MEQCRVLQHHITVHNSMLEQLLCIRITVWPDGYIILKYFTIYSDDDH